MCVPVVTLVCLTSALSALCGGRPSVVGYRPVVISNKRHQSAKRPTANGMARKATAACGYGVGVRVLLPSTGLALAWDSDCSGAVVCD